MINVYYLFVDTQKSFEPYRKYMRFVFENRQKKIERYYFDHSKITSLFAGLLSAGIISESTGIPFDKIKFCESENGKPYVCDAKDYHFSLSHSGDCIAFAENTEPVGIDTEEIKDAKTDIAKKYFVNEEYEYIKTNQSPDKAFFEIWTKKEAYVKMTGEGILRGFDTFSTFESKIKDKFYTWQQGQYMFSVYSDDLTSDMVNIKEISETELLKKFDDFIFV